MNALFHVPVVLARRLASLDQLSGGRLIAGLGQAGPRRSSKPPTCRCGGAGTVSPEYLEHCGRPGARPGELRGTFSIGIPPAQIGPEAVPTGWLEVIIGASPEARSRCNGRSGRLGPAPDDHRLTVFRAPDHAVP